jgi:hypothetical protein
MRRENCSRMARSYDTNEERAETVPAFWGRDYWDWVREYCSASSLKLTKPSTGR